MRTISANCRVRFSSPSSFEVAYSILLTGQSDIFLRQRIESFSDYQAGEGCPKQPSPRSRQKIQLLVIHRDFVRILLLGILGRFLFETRLIELEDGVARPIPDPRKKILISVTVEDQF